VYSSIRFGTEDYEDPSNVCNDVVVVTFYDWIGSTTARGVNSVCSSGWSSIVKAVKESEHLRFFGNAISWINLQCKI
jgi:hypothetical protein